MWQNLKTDRSILAYLEYNILLTIKHKIRLFELVKVFLKPILKLKKKLYYNDTLLLNYYKRYDNYTYL